MRRLLLNLSRILSIAAQALGALVIASVFVAWLREPELTQMQVFILYWPRLLVGIVVIVSSLLIMQKLYTIKIIYHCNTCGIICGSRCSKCNKVFCYQHLILGRIKNKKGMYCRECLREKVIRRDEYNRIMQIEIDGSTDGSHSVCTHCGKDMPSVWDTVCFECGRTLCYDCSHEKNGHWYCEVHK